MATTGTSSPSSSLIHHQRSPSPCNLNLRLRFSSPSSSVTVTPKRKCLCSPTTHPGSFRCAYHRRLEKEKKEEEEEKKNRGGGDVGLNLRKTALINSLARFIVGGGEGSVEEERFRRGLEMSLVRPSVFDFRRRSDEFRPRPSRFYAMHKDDYQD